jgi:hypothetical protein
MDGSGYGEVFLSALLVRLGFQSWDVKKPRRFPVGLIW